MASQLRWSRLRRDANCDPRAQASEIRSGQEIDFSVNTKIKVELAGIDPVAVAP
jgi:hypothetical protein